jgi:hypothetical protein
MKNLLARILERGNEVSATNIHLAPHSLVRLCGEKAFVVEVNGGSVWATAEGDSIDYLLSPGARQRLRGRNLVIEALTEPADVCLC